MPGGHRKKNSIKRCGKKNIIRSQNITGDKEKAKDMFQSLEGGEKVGEDVEAATSAEFPVEGPNIQTNTLQSNGDGPMLHPPLSSNIDHHDEQLKEKMEQLRADVIKYKSKCSKLEDELNVLSTAKQQDHHDEHIKELNIQVNHLSTEVDKYKSRCCKLEEELCTLSITKLQIDQQDNQNQLRLLNQKLTGLNTKLCESRNQCQQLKQELKLAYKALGNEVGENVCVQEIISGTSNWRGRAQQILALQQKISDLQNQLQEINKDSSAHAESTMARNKSAQVLKQLEKERRTMQENIEKQLRVTTAELEDVQKKLEGTRARNKVLEGEVVNLKSTVATLLEKGKHDDQLISALNVEIKRLESKLKEYQESQVVVESQWEEERQRYKKEIAQEKAKTSKLETIITKKDEEIRLLEEKLTQIKQQHFCLEENADSQPLNGLNQHNISESSCAGSKDAEYYQKSYFAAEGECTRLLELIAVYNQRLDEQRHKADDAEENFQRERQKSARLESKVAQLELEKSAAFKSTYSFRTCKQSSPKAPVIPQEIQDRLELLQEQNLTLQTRLKRLRQEKSDDLKMFTKLLSNRQQSFTVES